MLVLACWHAHRAAGQWLWCDRLLPGDLAVESDLLNQRSRQRWGSGLLSNALPSCAKVDRVTHCGKHAENRECHDCGTRRVRRRRQPSRSCALESWKEISHGTP